MEKPDDTLNIKINYLTFTICSANNRKNDRSWVIIHREILYIVMMSSIMATISWLKKHLRELLYLKSSAQTQASTSQLEKKDGVFKGCKRDRKRAAESE